MALVVLFANVLMMLKLPAELSKASPTVLVAVKS
jgi:hypothetical protein